MMKRPSFQFYPGDWQRDSALRSCSVGARGLWIECLCIMHQADPYGYLVLNGKPIEAPVLARLVGASTREVVQWLAELSKFGVTAIDANGAVYSRRMVRDEQVRMARAEGGKAGAEHGHKGAEHGKKGGRPVSNKGGFKSPLTDADEPPINPPPSSSVFSLQSSTSNQHPCANARTTEVHETRDQEIPAETHQPLPASRLEKPDGDSGFATFWQAYPRKDAKAGAQKAWRALKPDDALLGVILEALERAKTSEAWRKEGGQFIPLPATWIRGRRWEDASLQPAPPPDPDQPWGGDPRWAGVL